MLPIVMAKELNIKSCASWKRDKKRYCTETYALNCRIVRSVHFLSVIASLSLWLHLPVPLFNLSTKFFFVLDSVAVQLTKRVQLPQRVEPLIYIIIFCLSGAKYLNIKYQLKYPSYDISAGTLTSHRPPLRI